MDSFPQESDNVKSRFPGPSSLLLSRVTSAPEPRRLDVAFPSPFDLTSRKREFPSDRPYQRPAMRPSSPPTRPFWPSAGSSPHRESLDSPPDKRPRLDYIPEKMEGNPDFPARRMNDYVSQSVHSAPYQPPERPPDGGLPAPLSLGTCHKCSSAERLVLDLVRGFADLQAEMSHVLSMPLGSASPIEAIENEVAKLGLKESLAWTIGEIHNTVRLLRRNATTRPELPPLVDVVAPPVVHDTQRPSLHAQSPVAPLSINEPRRTLAGPDTSHLDDIKRRAPDQAVESRARAFDRSLPAIIPPDEMRRSQNQDQMYASIGQSPHPSSASSIFGSAQSPMQSVPSSLTLPSPTGLHFPHSASSASAQYSPTATPSAHHAHLHDLQHQISTKALALQTLQREHDQLLAAFSRSKIRCTALDKKSQVSDHEINTLTEDKIRLQQQVESLEAQVHELMKSRDEVHQQSSADGAQWRQIMAMSSQLQLKGAEDARRFREERERWEEERETLRKRIEALVSGKEALPETRTVSGSTTPVANDSILTSDSMDALRAEIVRLRRRCSELELLSQDLAGEAEQIEKAINVMESVRRNLAGQRQRNDDV